MSFTLTVIGTNTGSGWSGSIGGNAISGGYYESIPMGAVLSNGPVLNFTITDADNAGCSANVIVDANEF